MARNLSEVVICLRQLTLLHAEYRDLDLSHLALVVPAQKLGFEGGGFPSGQGVESLINTVNQLTRSDFIADRIGAIDGVVTNLGNQVNLNEVPLGDGAIHGD